MWRLSGWNSSNACASSSPNCSTDQSEIDRPTRLSSRACRVSRSSSSWQQCLYLRPLPHGHAAFRAVFGTSGTLRAGADGPALGCPQVRSLQSSAGAAMSGSDLQHHLDGALREVERLRAENARLRTLLYLAQRTQTILDAGKPEPPPAHASSPASADGKVALVRRLFRGRDDVYAVRWESASTGKSGYAPATAGGWGRQGPKSYLPLSNEAIEQHLRGRQSIGVYPLLTDDTCWFLACDLDGKTWQLDALALLEACEEHGVPAALERSRSGSGGHVWVFFPALSPPRPPAGSARCCSARR